jgi:hypothetical protein
MHQRDLKPRTWFAFAIALKIVNDRQPSRGLDAKPAWPLLIVALLGVIALAARPAGASIAFYLGKDLTADGTVLLGGYGDEPSSHWLRIVPRQEHGPDATIEVGVTEEANRSHRL